MAQVFTSLGQQLPVLTRYLIVTSDVLRQDGLLVLAWRAGGGAATVEQ